MFSSNDTTLSIFISSLPSFFCPFFHRFSPPPLVVLCRVLFQLYINTAMCVNTLRYECTTFYVEHRCARRPKEEAQKTKTIGLRRDGRNESSRDTFPCHYNPSKPNSTDQFVTIRYILSTISLSLSIGGVLIFLRISQK